MHFYSLLNPVNDESFTSWIRRCELKLSPRLFSSKKITSMVYSNIDCFPTLDPDFSVKTLASTSVNETIKVEPHILLDFFLPRTTWVIPFSDWQHACTSCLMDSLKKKRCYVFLKSWRYAAHPICSVHKCLLSPLPYKQRNSIKAFPGKYVGTHKSTLDSVSIKKLVLLALKIQRHIRHLENSTDNIALKMMAAYRFIMELFLSAGEYRGLACFLYSKPTAQRGALKHSGARARMLIGAFTASSFERMCALILTGYVIGAFSQSDARAFESISNEHSSLYSCTAYDIGRYSGVFPSDESPAIRRRLEKLCAVFPSQKYLDFLKGFGNV